MTNSTRNIFLFFLLLFIISSLLLGWLFFPFVAIIVLASVVTGVFRPFYKYLSIKLKPSIASLCTCVIIFIVLFTPTVSFVGILTNEAYDLFVRARESVGKDHIRSLMKQSEFIEIINRRLSAFNVSITGEQLNREIPQIGKAVGKVLFDQANQIGTNVLKFFVNFFFMLLIIYYLLIDADRLISFIADLSPLPEEQDNILIEKFKEMAGAVLIGNGFCGLIQGIIGGGVFWLFGFTSAFMWGVIMSLLAFLPIIGIGLVFIPASIYLCIQGKFLEGILFLVFYILLSGGVEYLFKPRLVGKRIQMHPLLVFLSLIGGLKIFGVIGIIYGPLIVTFFLTLTEIYHSSYQVIVEPKQVID